MKNICVITGSRAEYGLLSNLMRSIEKSSKLNLQVVVTGMHLSPEFGLTYREIEKDGFIIDKKIDIKISNDSPSEITKSTGVGMIGFADAFAELMPELVILLGDRYEIMAAAFSAFVARIPIGHIHGGESTQGAIDEAIRHSITKMSYWHFVATDEYKNRVIQLGENPSRVYNVGGLGVDSIKKSNLISKKELTNKMGIKFDKKNLLITYHPVTLEDGTSQKNFKSLINTLNELKDTYLIFTLPNSDSDSRVIKIMIKDFVAKNRDRSISFSSMGNLNYLSLLQFVDGVVGNSSSGLLEAPTFKIGTINIGDRQTGRIKADSVIDCKPNQNSVSNAIKKLYSNRFQNKLKTVDNPYGAGKATEKIMAILNKEILPNELKKEFYDL
tara:strand:+ start:13434 stop:14588 length:1155 start_codon:yes stop_codon:yes gene_type:complete